MPSADCLSEVPLNRSTSTHTQDLDRLITGSRTNTEVSHKRHSCDNRFPGRPETLPGKMSNPRRFLPFSFRSSCSHSIFTLFLALTIVHSVFGQNANTNPLVPELEVPPSPQEELTEVTINCKLILLSDFPLAGDFPLSWSRSGGLPSGAQVDTNEEVDGTARTYYSALTFRVVASVNNNPITCDAVTPGNSGSKTFTPSVILRPSQPVIQGPTEVRAGEEEEWTCTTSGASVVSPNVLWRNGQGTALIDGVSHSAGISQDSYQNRLYAMTSVLRKALPSEGAVYTLLCRVIHEYQGYSYSTDTTLNVNLRYPPQLRKATGDAQSTTETVKTTISCIIESSNPVVTSVSWTKDGQPIDFSSRRYEVVTVSKPSLVISSAQQSDEGDYICTATNVEGTTSFDTPTTLRVLYAPKIAYPGGTSFQATLGASYTLPCPVDALPDATNIRWKRVSQAGVETYLDMNDVRYSGSVPSATGLTISPVEANDQGSYSCEADNNVGPGRGPVISLTVNYDPVVNVPSSVTAKEGDSSFTISCDIQMYPAATSIIWYKDDNSFDPAATPSKYQGGTLASPTLTVLSPSGSDSGVYKCRASNGQGVDLTSPDIPVTITYAPKLTAPTALLIADIGQSVTLQVSVDAVPGISSILWQTSDIDSGSSVRTDLSVGGRVSGGSLTNPSLTITNLQPSDAAYYYITVTSDEGPASAGPIPLRVRYSPNNVQVTASPSVLQPGSALTLTCSADAWPDIISYQWTREDSGGTVLPLGTGPVYTKTQVGTDDWSFFRCSVTNDVSTQSATIRPNIQFAPIQTNPGVVLESTPIGNTVTLTCDVTANPEPTYIWYRGANVIPGAVARTYTLQVDDATDFTDFACSATNSIGSLNPAVEFTIQESDANVGASISEDSGLSTATIVLIIIIVIIFLIIVILLIIFCCMQGLCAKWCGKTKETAKVAPTTYSNTPPQPAPVYMNGGMVGTRAEPTTKVMLDDEPNDVDKQFRPLNPGAIISVPEKQGPRAHYLPPLTTENENENVDNYYREEKRRSRRKRKHRRNRQADDQDALTGADNSAGASGGSPSHLSNGGATTPGRSAGLDSNRSYMRAPENVYEN